MPIFNDLIPVDFERGGDRFDPCLLASDASPKTTDFTSAV
jgi:hypothetical protein